jgi:hypothetical protein
MHDMSKQPSFTSAHIVTRSFRLFFMNQAEDVKRPKAPYGGHSFLILIKIVLPVLPLAVGLTCSSEASYTAGLQKKKDCGMVAPTP